MDRDRDEYSSPASCSSEDSSSQTDQAQFKRIYQRQMQLKQQKLQKEQAQRKKKFNSRNHQRNLTDQALRLQRNDYERKRQRDGRLDEDYQRKKERGMDRIFQSRQRQRSRSRDQPKPSHSIRWHIYEKVPKIDYSDYLPEQLRKLSIFKKQTEILQSLIQNQVILVTGDTGCGKSTQVPRMIYQYLQAIQSTDKIICVQPRRLAVTTLQDTVEKQLHYRSRVKDRNKDRGRDSTYKKEQGRSTQHQNIQGGRIVGYQIGQKAFINPSTNRIVFMTNGIFLQRLVHNIQFLQQYPFIILDQVHQRDIDTDFILTALKRVIRRFPKVRLILMSATIDNDLFRYYFASDHIDTFMNDQNFYKRIIKIEADRKARKQEKKKKKQEKKRLRRLRVELRRIEQNQNGLQHIDLDNRSEESEGFASDLDADLDSDSDSDSDDDSNSNSNLDPDSDSEHKARRKVYQKVALQFINSQYPCPAINVNEPSNYNRTYFYLDTLNKFVTRQYSKNWGNIIFSRQSASIFKQQYDVVYQILSQIVRNTDSLGKQKGWQKNLSAQAVLIFLPGLAQIQSLSEHIIQSFGGRNRTYHLFDIIHVHSSIMTEEIQRQLQIPNNQQIKLILSTNIAQSSITVKGVKYIVDFCLTKEIRFQNKSRMENLQMVWASKASCRQRAGRTGRVCDGLIFRLVQKKFFEEKLDKYSEPEIKRSSLDRLILRIKLMNEEEGAGFDRDRERSNYEEQGWKEGRRQAQQPQFKLFVDPPSVLGTCIQPPVLQNIQASINSLKFCGAIEHRKRQQQKVQSSSFIMNNSNPNNFSDTIPNPNLNSNNDQQQPPDTLLNSAVNPSPNLSPDQLQITDLGRLYVDLPIDISYSKMLVFSTIMGTFQDTLILVSILSQNKNPFRKKQIEKNYLEYFDKIQNPQQCDFTGLIKAYKNQDQQWEKAQVKGQNNRNSGYKPLRFDTRRQTKNTIDDILKRLQRKKQWFSDFGSVHCNDNLLPSKDYHLRFKLTLAFGFIDKFILVKHPIYTEKQQKRIRHMRKNDISNVNTIVLLNSSVLTKPTTVGGHQAALAVQQRLKTHWQQILKKSLHMGQPPSITFGIGLTYLHFSREIDLLRLLNIRYFHSLFERKYGGGDDRGHGGKYNPGKVSAQDVFQNTNRQKKLQQQQYQNKPNYNHKSSLLSVTQVVHCLGELDLMQQGCPVTFYKQNRLVIDQFSLNRVVNIDEGQKYRYLLTNTIMQQNHSLICRFTSILGLASGSGAQKSQLQQTSRLQPQSNSIPYLHIKVNLLFWPFLSILTNKQQTLYAGLGLRKKHRMPVQYLLTRNQIDKANQIRQSIKEFFSREREINDENRLIFYSALKKFVLNRRRHVICEDKWQGQFMKEKEHQKEKQVSRSREGVNKSMENTLKNLRENVQNKVDNPTDPKKIVQEIVQEKLKCSESINRNNENGNNSTPIAQPRGKQFMNKIIPKPLKGSLFVRNYNNSSQYVSRIQEYRIWKQKKLQSILAIKHFIQNVDSYLCCGYSDCLTPICKLKRIGPILQDTYRELFEPIQRNIKEAGDHIGQGENQQSELHQLEAQSQEENNFLYHLANLNLQDQYKLYACKNGHLFGLRFQSQSKIKILESSKLVMQFPDGSVQKIQFDLIESNNWLKNQKISLTNKKYKIKTFQCFACGQTTNDYEQLKMHFADEYHKKKISDLQETIQQGLLQQRNQENEIFEEFYVDEQNLLKQQQEQEENKNNAANQMQIEY